MTMPIRIQRRRTKGWRMPENTVYVGRPGKFGNPFAPMIIPGWSTGSREYAVEDYKRWLFHKHGTTMKAGNIVCWCFNHGDRQIILDSVHILAGKNLACWCPPGQPCHADVLLELANRDAP